MPENPRRNLLQLNKFNRWLTVTYWRFLLVKQNYFAQSLPLRLVPFHAISMLLLILSSFSIDDLSMGRGRGGIFVLASILFAAAYYITLLILFISPSAYKSQIKVKEEAPRPHWVR